MLYTYFHYFDLETNWHKGTWLDFLFLIYSHVTYHTTPLISFPLLSSSLPRGHSHAP